MIYQTETKLQGWRALVIFEDRSECLLFVGRSTTQIRQGYQAAFAEVLDDEERSRVRSISLQCWQGASDKGHWVTKGTLNVPGHKAVPVEAVRSTAPAAAADSDEETEGPTILAFPETVAEAESKAEALPLVLPRRKAPPAKTTPPRGASMLA
jgi:hypothetical protein